MNVKIKYYLITSVPKDKYGTLLYRCIQGAFGFMCLYTSIKYFPLVITSLVQNTTPLLIALFQWKLHSVKLSNLDKATLGVSFIGVIVLVTGTISKDTSSN